MTRLDAGSHDDADRPGRDEVREATASYDTSASRASIDAQLIDQIVSRVVQAADPDRIILFGSAGRGEAGPESDIDLLVIKSGIESRGAVEDLIHMNLFGLEISVDVVVATPSDVEYLKDRVGSVIGPAIKEGREVYARPSA